MDNFLLIGILVVMAGLMFYTSRQNKKRQQDSKDFRNSLNAGDEVMTGSGLIGKIESVNLENNYVIIKSEDSKSRWLIDAITKLPEIVTENASAIDASEEKSAVSKTSAAKKSTTAKKVTSAKKATSTKKD